MSPLSARARLRRRRIRITGWTALSSLLVTIVGFLVFFHTVFAAERDATLEVYRDTRVVVEPGEGLVVMKPAGEANETALLYFPGARVSAYAYLWPLLDVAASGTTVVIAQPLMNMALFDPRGLDSFAPAAPGATTWILAGHSLGGVKACLEAADARVSALVLFASYCANDISSLEREVRVVLGGADGVIDLDAVNTAAALLPDSSVVVSIPGANHASFGTYGPQPGDGIATREPSQVRKEITTLVAELLKKP